MRTRGFIGFWAVLGFLLAISLPAAAQEVETLETVVVTAGRIEEKVRHVTQAMTVIPREEILKNQSREMGDLLRNYGIQISGNAGNENFSQIAIRGMRSSLFGTDLQSPVMTLVNGRRIGTSNISMIPMVNIERIEILRGAAAVQYGTSAMGGVVNIITRRGSEEPQAALEVGGDTWMGFRALGEFAGMKGDVDFSGGLTYANVDKDYRTGKNETYHNTSQDHRIGFSADLGYNFAEEHRLGFSVIGVQAEGMGMPNEMKYNDRESYSDRQNHSVEFIYEGGYKDYGLNWMSRYFNGYDKYEAHDFQWGYSEIENEFQGAQGQASLEQGVFTFTAGLDWLKYDVANTYSTSSGKYDNVGVFLLGKAALFAESLILSAGVRYDTYTLEIEGEDDDLDKATPSFGIAWLPTDWLTLRGNYGQSYRIPQALELVGMPAFDYIGNSDLRPEKGKGGDIGFEINYESLNLGLTYFQTDYKDKIASVSLPGNITQYQNLDGTTKYRGLEAQLSYDLGAAFDWPFMLKPYVNLTHLLKYEDADNNKVRNVSNNDIAYGVNFSHPDSGLDVDVRVVYFGHQYEMDWGSYEEVKTGGDTTVDLFVTQRIAQWENGTLSVKGELRNMFDVDYATTLNYPLPGRSFYLGLRYDY